MTSIDEVLDGGVDGGRFTVARFLPSDTELLDASQRFRATVYRAHGFLQGHQLTADGRDECPDDDRSVHVVVLDGTARIVGNVRVILDRPGRPVPTTAPPFAVLPPAAPHGEISRLAISGGRAGMGLAPLLWREAFWIARDEGLEYLYAEMEEFLLHLVTEVGLPFEVLGQPVHVYNTDNFPTRVRIPDVVPAVARVNPSLAYFLAHRGDGLFSFSHLAPDPESLELFMAGLGDTHD